MTRLDSGGFGSSDSSGGESDDTEDADESMAASQMSARGDEGLQPQSEETADTAAPGATDVSRLDRGELSASPISADESEKATSEEQQDTQQPRDETLRANESVSLSTTGVGTSGTRRSRTRSRTPMAGSGPGFGTDTFGARAQSQDGATLERAENIGGDATTAADRELQEGEQRERVRSRVESQLEEQGIDTDRVNIDVQRGADGFSAEVTAREQDEQFGDFTLTLGGEADDARTEIGTRLATNEANPAAPENYTGDVTFEEAASDLSEDYRGFVGEQFSAEYDTVSGDVVGFFAGEEAGDTTDTAIQTTAETSLQSLNPFQAALGIKEGVEFVGYTGLETARGNLGVNVNLGESGDPTATQLLRSERDSPVNEGVITTTDDGLVGRVGRAGGAAATAGVDYATKNPVRAGGAVVGSLLGTAAVMGAASKVGRGAGFASRAAIQPGEEIAGVGGYYATRAVSSTRTADRLFPNKEPLIFSEEAAIRGAKAAGRFSRSGASRGLNVGKSAVARARSRLPDRSDVVPDRSGNSFFIDQRTGELVEEGSIRPALIDPDAETDVTTGDRPDMLSEFEPEGETESTPGSGASGGNELSGAVEIDMAKDSGMVETSLLEFESETSTETEAVAEAEAEPRLTVDTRTESEIETETGVPRVEVNDVSEVQNTAETFGIDVESEQPQLQPEQVIEGIDIEERVGTETENPVGLEVGMGTEQEFETGLEQEFEQEFEQEVEQEAEAETRREVELLFDPADDVDEVEEDELFGGLRENVLTDFRNPLTGETETTDSEPEVVGLGS